MEITQETNARTGEMTVVVKITEHDLMRADFTEFDFSVLRTPKKNRVSDTLMDLQIIAQAVERADTEGRSDAVV